MRVVVTVTRAEQRARAESESKRASERARRDALQAVEGEGEAGAVLDDGAALGVDAEHAVARVVDAHLLARDEEGAALAAVREDGASHWALH